MKNILVGSSQMVKLHKLHSIGYTNVFPYLFSNFNYILKKEQKKENYMFQYTCWMRVKRMLPVWSDGGWGALW